LKTATALILNVGETTSSAKLITPRRKKFLWL
jgi:hypothetical protein